jgi:hypothetical protein
MAKHKKLHWTRQNFEIGQKVRIYSNFNVKLPESGVVKATRKNQFGRISYKVKGSDGKLHDLLLEELVPDRRMAVR